MSKRGRNGSAVAAFIGTTPNIGTTAAAFATAYRVAERCEGTVGYLCLHLKSAKLHRYLGIEEPEATLDRLQPELRSAALTPGMLTGASCALRHQPNLRILFGSLNREQAEFFTVEEIEQLLLAAEQAFSLVVLDVGAYWDNAATVCAMRSATSRILVTTPALSHFQEDGRRWIGQVSPMFHVPREQYECVVVQPHRGKNAYGMRHICQELGIAPLGRFQLTESLFASLDGGSYDRWLATDSIGKKAMLGTAGTLVERYALEQRTASVQRQPWYRGLLTHRRGMNSYEGRS
ncbi:hypothetical protein M6D81_27820 [Paenibacillus sp. J5C_2022]|uniref:hypothetical protein n=1 Tax=Paenibacillus sp. J5C2022 TaxID=2977129 RepID=UPI0021CF6D92|nr:hypothetical protein [Paenibacillus sp. J5C2022]MCU6712511.1 hypothetical protein [Paenibacillus sp. J5C2022]